MLRQKVYMVTVAACVICLFIQVQHVSGVTRKTVYITQDESGVRYSLNKGNDTKWLAKGYYAALNNDTGWVQSTTIANAGGGVSAAIYRSTGEWRRTIFFKMQCFSNCGSRKLGEEGDRWAIMHLKLYPSTQSWEAGRSVSFRIVVAENIPITGKTICTIPLSL
jgi:hypothetical protein